MSLSKSMCGFFKRNCLGLNPCCFLQPEVMGAYLPGTGTLGLGAGMGLGLLAREISLSNFYPSHVDVGLACSVSLPLLPVWMDVISSIP